MKRMDPFFTKMITIFGIFFGGVIGMAGALSYNDGAAYFGGSICILAILFDVLFYRCPHCGKYLGKNSTSGYCPHCGRKIYEDEEDGGV